MSEALWDYPGDPHFIGVHEGGNTYRSLCKVMVYIGLSPAMVERRNAKNEGIVSCPDCRQILEELGVSK